MNILLDSQVFIWLVTEDPKLGSESKKKLISTENNLHVSFLSFFEMAIKASLGKLNFDPSIIKDLEKMDISLVPGDYESLSVVTSAPLQQNPQGFDNQD